ncbi:MAG TPA: hypothetical protein VFS55_11895 [Dokdonella sp.]|nr:hypothetical protein [Dokdonella sp.]
MPTPFDRRLFVTLAVGAAFALPIAAIAKPPAAAATAAKEAAPQALKFAKDGTHASAKGKLKGPGDISRTYTVDLKAGHTYAVAVDDGKLRVTYFNVFPPGAPPRETEGRSRMDVKAAADGAYTIRVFMTQGAAVKGASASYRLTVTQS